MIVSGCFGPTCRTCWKRTLGRFCPKQGFSWCFLWLSLCWYWQTRLRIRRSLLCSSRWCLSAGKKPSTLRLQGVRASHAFYFGTQGSRSNCQSLCPWRRTWCRGLCLRRGYTSRSSASQSGTCAGCSRFRLDRYCYLRRLLMSGRFERPWCLILQRALSL